MKHKRIVEAFAEALKEARASSGLTLRQVEHMTGISNAIISQYENGMVMPSLYSASLLASALDFSLDEVASNITPKEIQMEIKVGQKYRDKQGNCFQLTEIDVPNDKFTAQMYSMKDGSPTDFYLKGEFSKLPHFIKAQKMGLVLTPEDNIDNGTTLSKAVVDEQ